jgi:hypothetical protein
VFIVSGGKMKKRIIALITLILLTGCGSKGPIIKTDNYYFKLANREIAIGQEAKAFIATLGEPKDRYSSPSCAFKGDDTVYVYDGYQLTTFVSDGVEKFTGFYLLDKSVSTKEGIHIGSSFDEMVAAYGNEYTESYGAYTYSRGLTDLSFVIVDKTVTSISYLYVVD